MIGGSPKMDELKKLAWRVSLTQSQRHICRQSSALSSIFSPLWKCAEYNSAIQFLDSLSEGFCLIQSGRVKWRMAGERRGKPIRCRGESFRSIFLVWNRDTLFFFFFLFYEFMKWVCVYLSLSLAAVCWKAGEPPVMQEVMVAPPLAGEVRIRIICTSLCHSDIFFWKLKVRFTFELWSSGGRWRNFGCGLWLISVYRILRHAFREYWAMKLWGNFQFCHWILGNEFEWEFQCDCVILYVR